MKVKTGPPRRPARERLLERAIEYLAAHGLSDITLRQLAAALGTSHRMLIYHFHSKEGLLVAVVQAVEAGQRQALAQMIAQARGEPLAMARLFWRQLRDPSLAPHERLFFELYGQALQGRSHAMPLLEGIVDSWIEPVAALLRAEGFEDNDARAEARLGIAVTRGLLLDLLATGDVAGVDAAHERYLAGLEARRRAISGDASATIRSLGPTDSREPATIRALDITDDQDAAAILDLQRASYRVEAELIGSDTIPPLHDTPVTLRASGETFQGYVLQGALAGIIAYKRAGDLLDIHRLAVHPSYFRRGIAQALLAHVTAIEQGVTRTFVSTGARNEPARAFYLKQGFQEVGDREVLPGLRITAFAR